MDRGLRRGVARHMDDVEGVAADMESEPVGEGHRRRVGGRVVRVPDEPDAVRIGLLETLAFLFERAESGEIALETFLQLDLPDHRDVREIGVAGDVVAMRLGVDQIADRRLVLHALAPAYRVDRLLRRVDHDVAVAGLDKARIAAGEIDFGKRVWSNSAHRSLLFSISILRPPAPRRAGTRRGRRQRTTGLIAATRRRRPARVR